MPDWATGEDLRARLRDLRVALGDGTAPLAQDQFAKLWGRSSYKTVSEWERGKALPQPGTISLAVSRNGWDARMFQEGAPMPSKLLQRPAGARSANGRGMGRVDTLKRQIAIWAVEYERRGEVLGANVVAGWMQMLEDAIRSEDTALEAPAAAPPSESRRKP